MVISDHKEYKVREEKLVQEENVVLLDRLLFGKVNGHLKIIMKKMILLIIME